MMRHIFFITTITLIFCSQAFAEVTFVGATGYSNIDTTTTSAGITIFGGFPGSETAGDCATEQDGESPCNNCAGAIEVCNRRRAYGNLKLKISFIDTENAGTAYMITSNNGAITTDSSSTATTENGVTSTVVVTWANLCNAISSDSSCATSTSATIQVGIYDTSTTLKDSLNITITIHSPAHSGDSIPEHQIDTCNNDTLGGICDFMAYPGDKKVYITEPQSSGSFPTLTNINATHLRVFYSTGDFSTINNNSDFVDLEIESTSSSSSEANLKTKTVANLSNEQVYYFRVATVDQVGNVSRMTSQIAIEDNATSGCSSINEPTTNYTNCDYMAHPSEVLGLLNKDINCFIATATYNSQMANKVKTFRKFRQDILLKSKWGKKMNYLYYNYGPKAARLIHKNELLKAYSRVLLWPAWAFVTMSLKWGLLNATLVFLLGFILLGFSCYYFISFFQKKVKA